MIVALVTYKNIFHDLIQKDIPVTKEAFRKLLERVAKEEIVILHVKEVTDHDKGNRHRLPSE